MAVRAGGMQRLMILATLLLAPVIASGPARALSYSWVEYAGAGCRPSCLAVAATGTIGMNEGESFAAFAGRIPAGRKLAKVMFIHSPGGIRAGGMTLGLMMRKLGYAVVVAQSDGSQHLHAGFCASACVYILAGGARRIVPAGSKVGVHTGKLVQNSFQDRMSGVYTEYRYNRAENEDEIASYYRMVGASPELARLAHNTPHESVRILTPAELGRYLRAQAR